MLVPNDNPYLLTLPTLPGPTPPAPTDSGGDRPHTCTHPRTDADTVAIQNI